jgi:hypothetical protein
MRVGGPDRTRICDLYRVKVAHQTGNPFIFSGFLSVDYRVESKWSPLGVQVPCFHGHDGRRLASKAVCYFSTVWQDGHDGQGIFNCLVYGVQHGA